jgi:aryl-alcohol dehydrogenase-like predicted oxidoreductase
MEACEASLKRLGTDYLDIYELHGIDPNTSFEDTMRALDDLVSQGKTRYVGCSNFSGWQMAKCMGIADKYGWNRFVTLESMYSLLARGLEFELIPACLDMGVVLLAYSPLHAGILSGKYRRDKPWPAGTRIRSLEEAGPWAYDPEKLFRLIDEMDVIAGERHVTVAQVALNWVLQKPGVGSIIVAARNETQMAEILKSADWQMTPEETAKLDAVSEPERAYPYAVRDPNAKI